MALRYCFEESNAIRIFSKSRKNDLAVIDTDGISTAAIKAACAREFMVTSTQERG